MKKQISLTHTWRTAVLRSFGFDWIYPAHEFERLTGMTGIAADYVLPNRQTSLSLAFDLMEDKWRNNLLELGPDLENGLHYIVPYFIVGARKAYAGNLREGKDVEKYARSIAEKIIKLNQSLHSVRLNLGDPQNVYNFVMGVTSGFNPEDIDFYINEKRYTPEFDDWRILNQALREKIGFNIGWVPSPQTVDRIKSHFGLAGWVPTPDVLEAERRGYQKDMCLQFNI